MPRPAIDIDREASRLEHGLECTLREARARTRAAVAKTVAHDRADERRRRSRGVQIAWRRLPGVRRTGGGRTVRRRLHLGRAAHRGTHTIHFALGQTSSGKDAAAHQRYIERDGACVASIGNIADTLEERERLWRELEARATKRSGRIELGPGVPPAVKRSVLDDVAALRGPTPGGLERDYVDRLRALGAEELDAAKFAIRTNTKAEHQGWIESLASRLEATSLREPDADTRSQNQPAPPESEWPPGVRLYRTRAAAVVVAATAPAGTKRAIAELAATRDEARAIGLTRDEWEAWSAGEAPPGEHVLRTRHDTAEAIVERLRKVHGLDADEDVPGVQIATRPTVAVRLEQGAPPLLKSALLDWWSERSGGESPWLDRAGQARWKRLRDTSLEHLDGERIHLDLPGSDSRSLKATMRKTLARVRAEPDAPGHTSGYEATPEPVRGQRFPGVRDYVPRESIVQRRIIIELAHELGARDREEALRAWCEKNLRGVGWHAVIHEPEAANDARNWHAHVVYTNVAVERRKSGFGWTFEDEPKRPEPTETIRTLTGNGALKGQGRNLLIQRWRKDIAELQNSRLAAHGIDKIYDHRSYAAMGIDRAPGEHLGPGRFRRELDGTTTARGPRAAAWSDAEAALDTRLRREGMDGETRSLACDLLELQRLVHALPNDVSGARAELAHARDEAAAAFLDRAGPTIAAAANREIAEWLDDVVLAPEPEPRRWWAKAAAEFESIQHPQLARATAEHRWGHRLADPDLVAARAAGDRVAEHLAGSIEAYRDTMADERRTARDALASALDERRRNEAAEAVEAEHHKRGYDSPVLMLGYALGTDIAERAARARRRRALVEEIATWGRACRLSDDPEELRGTTRMLHERNIAALEENPKLAERFAAVTRRAGRAAALRRAWQRTETREDVQALARRYRRLLGTLTRRERTLVEQRIPATERPRDLLAKVEGALADPGPAGSAVLHALTRDEWLRARAYAARPAGLGWARVQRERHEDARLDRALERCGPEPTTDHWLQIEHAHASALERRPDVARRLSDALRAKEPEIRVWVASQPPAPNDESAYAALRLDAEWSPARRAKMGADGPAWDAHRAHAATRQRDERDAARVALRERETSPDLLLELAADRARLRWLDAPTQNAVRRASEDARLDRALERFGPEPNSTQCLFLEYVHENALGRRPELARHVAETIARKTPSLRKWIASLPAAPNDRSAFVAARGAREWSPERHRQMGAHGPDWDAHLLHASERLAEERDAARVALRERETSPDLLLELAADRARLRWLDAPTQNAVRRASEDARLDRALERFGPEPNSTQCLFLEYVHENALGRRPELARHVAETIARKTPSLRKWIASLPAAPNDRSAFVAARGAREWSPERHRQMGAHGPDWDAHLLHASERLAEERDAARAALRERETSPDLLLELAADRARLRWLDAPTQNAVRRASEDARLDRALERFGPEPNSTQCLFLEYVHENALGRRPELARHVAETIARKTPSLRKWIASLPAAPNDRSAFVAARGAREWSPERHRQMGAHGPDWDAHLLHASERLAEERDAARAALRERETSPDLLLELAADRARLRWLDAPTQNAVRRASEDARLDRALERYGPEPTTDHWLLIEHAHESALERRPDVARRLSDAISAEEPELRAWVASQPPAPNDESAYTALRLDAEWSPARRAKMGAEGPAWDAHRAHAATRQRDERDAARAALRDRGADPVTLHVLAADRARLRWLDEPTQNAVRETAAATPDPREWWAHASDHGLG